MVEEETEYRVFVEKSFSFHTRKPTPSFTIGIERKSGRRRIKTCTVHIRWHKKEKYYRFFSFTASPHEDEKFFNWVKSQPKQKRGRYLWEEVSIHLSEWLKEGGRIDYPPTAKFPKGFMHRQYAEMEPVLDTPNGLLEMRPLPHPVPHHEKAFKDVLKRGRRRRPR